MQRRHHTLLATNHDFLVNEIPVDETIDAIRNKNILNWHDFEQLKTLRHQGRKALARYLLAVLPHRGSTAFQAFLESLQEANAQHLVDLLLQQAGAVNLEELFQSPPPGNKTPTDTPLPLGPDPHEYAVRLMRNAKFIREFVDPAEISPVLTQNKVITAREADMVVHIHGRTKKWELILAALLQRGERAYQAFMAALLQKGYSAVFHAIQETTTELSGSDDDDDLSDGVEVRDDILDSDDELKAEVTQSVNRGRISENLLQDNLSRHDFSRVDDSLWSTSADLKQPAADINHMSNRARWEDTEDYDNSGGNEWGNWSSNNKHDAGRKGPRRISNAGNLNSVQEEPDL
ncbi:uncharacterized protein LOC131936460 [Physella acuta]|uniref:uncharacterized protein LOC131936460 n=1 Tax=Physella acuta TaxID=109671 RepID=UPI0027DB86C4|nr:uncharacterized protein LOC131936460 [Physella acuta]XP_059149457.1 uncharacterized protein LOC131936460 [Physella acuta]